jgi:hypothetical protein
MLVKEQSIDIYRLHAWICHITPMIWRRLLMRSDSTIVNRFHIHGQDYGVYHDGGIGFSTDPDQVRLSDFRFRSNERFLAFSMSTTSAIAGSTSCVSKNVWIWVASESIRAALAANGKRRRKIVAAR